MPAFNVENFIEESIKSVLEQTYSNFELIIVDDGSTDNTVNYIRKYSESDQRVLLLEQKNSGPGIARNKGLKYAKGDLICFIDSDDLFHKDRLLKMLTIFNKHKDIDLVFHDEYYIDEVGNIIEGTYLENVDFLKKSSDYLYQTDNNLYLEKKPFYNYMSAYDTSMNTLSIMFRAKLLQNQSHYFLTDTNIGEDIDLWFRLAKGSKIAYLNECLSYYRVRQDSLTRDSIKMSQGFIFAHGKNYQRAKPILTKKERHFYRSRIAREFRILAYKYRTNGKKKQAILHYLMSLKFHIKLTIPFHIAKVFFK